MGRLTGEAEGTRVMLKGMWSLTDGRPGGKSAGKTSANSVMSSAKSEESLATFCPCSSPKECSSAGFGGVALACTDEIRESAAGGF